jgi:hypothetical protein
MSSASIKQNTIKQEMVNHHGLNGMGNRIKKAMIGHRPWSLEAPNVENRQLLSGAVRCMLPVEMVALPGDMP